jgi:tetratricopeptide (TPR) repeat protein
VLASHEPHVALELLDRYFALGENFDNSQAHVDRATAYMALGETGNAIASYEAALRREDEFPHSTTQAYLDLPYLIAIKGIEHRFNDALDILERFRSRLLFPVQHFVYHGSRAIILSRKDIEAARHAATLALDAASIEHSGFRYHPTVGLVSARYGQLLGELTKLLDIH